MSIQKVGVIASFEEACEVFMRFCQGETNSQIGAVLDVHHARVYQCIVRFKLHLKPVDHLYQGAGLKDYPREHELPRAEWGRLFTAALDAPSSRLDLYNTISHHLSRSRQLRAAR